MDGTPPLKKGKGQAASMTESPSSPAKTRLDTTEVASWFAEVKPKNLFLMALGQAIIYSISLMDSCGGFLGCVILGQYFLRLVALADRAVAIETKDASLIGRTVSVLDLPKMKGMARAEEAAWFLGDGEEGKTDEEVRAIETLWESAVAGVEIVQGRRMDAQLERIRLDELPGDGVWAGLLDRTEAVRMEGMETKKGLLFGASLARPSDLKGLYKSQYGDGQGEDDEGNDDDGNDDGGGGNGESGRPGGAAGGGCDSQPPGEGRDGAHRRQGGGDEGGGDGGAPSDRGGSDAMRSGSGQGGGKGKQGGAGGRDRSCGDGVGASGTGTIRDDPNKSGERSRLSSFARIEGVNPWPPGKLRLRFFTQDSTSMTTTTPTPTTTMTMTKNQEDQVVGLSPTVSYLCNDTSPRAEISKAVLAASSSSSSSSSSKSNTTIWAQSIATGQTTPHPGSYSVGKELDVFELLESLNVLVTFVSPETMSALIAEGVTTACRSQSWSWSDRSPGGSEVKVRMGAGADEVDTELNEVKMEGDEVVRGRKVEHEIRVEERQFMVEVGGLDRLRVYPVGSKGKEGPVPKRRRKNVRSRR